MKFYKCDCCGKEEELKQSKIKEMERYVSPYSCYGGDYYTHDYFFFNCKCGRKIEVNRKDIFDRFSLEKVEDKNHSGRCIMNIN